MKATITKSRNHLRQTERDAAFKKAIAEKVEDRNALIEELQGILQIADDSTIYAALKAGLDFGQILREQAADRGMDADGKWIGFDAAKKYWLEQK